MKRLLRALTLAIVFNWTVFQYALCDNWQRDLIWCHHDTDGASGSCAWAWQGNMQCMPGGQGKRCIIDTAIRFAKAGECEAAAATAVTCQCDLHNSGASRINSAGQDNVCNFLANDLQAGTPPEGSYKHSCKESTMLGSTLTAYCQEENGNWALSELDTTGCREIGNINGQLRCFK